MYRKYISLIITLFIINGCGAVEETDSSTTTNVNGATRTSNFTYKTQRTVDVSITTPQTIGSAQRQVLLFETQKAIIDANTPGEILTFESLLAEGSTGNNNKYENNLTLGSHIESIWIVIPSLAYQEKIEILNNQIILNITKGF